MALPDLAKRLLSGKNFATITTLLKDGSPSASVVWVDTDGENVIFYLTVYNEPVAQPAEPEGVDVEGILKGIHHVDAGEGDGPQVQLLASGVGFPWVREAQRLLREEWGVRADTWSVTSWNELARDGAAAEEWNLLHPGENPRTAYVSQKLANAGGPVVAEH